MDYHRSEAAIGFGTPFCQRSSSIENRFDAVDQPATVLHRLT